MCRFAVSMGSPNRGGALGAVHGPSWVRARGLGWRGRVLEPVVSHQYQGGRGSGKTGGLAGNGIGYISYIPSTLYRSGDTENGGYVLKSEPKILLSGTKQGCIKYAERFGSDLW